MTETKQGVHDEQAGLNFYLGDIVSRVIP
jgi:hypothetical protein